MPPLQKKGPPPKKDVQSAQPEKAAHPPPPPPQKKNNKVHKRNTDIDYYVKFFNGVQSLVSLSENFMVLIENYDS